MIETANIIWLIVFALGWTMGLMTLRWMKCLRLIRALWIALAMHVSLALGIMSLQFEGFHASGWVSWDGLCVVVTGGLGWSLIAGVMITVAVKLRETLPRRWRDARLVTLPYSLDERFRNGSRLAETMFLFHGLVIACLWLMIELLSSHSDVAFNAVQLVSYLEWPLFFLNVTLWNEWGEANFVSGTLLSALIFGTAVYTTLGWLIDLVSDRDFQIASETPDIS